MNIVGRDFPDHLTFTLLKALQQASYANLAVISNNLLTFK